eukprot:472564-Prorocentrum_minimum.AAC.1
MCLVVDICRGAGSVTTGASDDLQKATGLAENMVGVYGMSQVVGPRAVLPPPEGGVAGGGARLGSYMLDAAAPSQVQADHEVRTDPPASVARIGYARTTPLIRLTCFG